MTFLISTATATGTIYTVARFL